MKRFLNDSVRDLYSFIHIINTPNHSLRSGLILHKFETFSKSFYEFFLEDNKCSDKIVCKCNIT